MTYLDVLKVSCYVYGYLTMMTPHQYLMILPSKNVYNMNIKIIQPSNVQVK